ncbi:MAG TPA: HAMP domain-containing sensor histidine kinase [Gemmataceae bacterium]|nr:HAMP domain-containing sensor histidine kinase [Gemmataceae bacterium]
MARRRRLRHKLMLGLTVVIGSVGLLLGGTLYGLNAYLTTVKTTERKLTELQQVNILIAVLRGQDQAGATDVSADLQEFRDKTQKTQIHLSEYRKFHAETVRQGLDPDDGETEIALLNKLEAELKRLDAALDNYGRVARSDADPSSTLRNDPAVKKYYDDSRLVAEHLRMALIDDVRVGIERSNQSIRQSLWIVGGATVWTGLILLTLLYYFREWMFTPIRVLQAGVQRVHSGDFDQPILLTSGDELEELANEFNAMTARLSAIYRDLARQVNERSRQLVRSERMVSVGFLAAGVAHEINNPLASILFCAEALERRLQEVLADAIAAPEADAEVLTRYLKMIQQEALRCKDITQKLLDFSRTGERKREPTDLAGLIRGVLEVARHLPNCRGKNITFEPDAYIVAPVNAQDLKSVILNLVVNALDSTDEGGSLTIRLSANGAFAEMAFTDTGCGMAPDVLQNIFEPFFTRSRTGKGTGLGLFISHQIIDQHGGSIEAASPGPGHGSTFTVRVPLQDDARNQEAGDRGQANPGDPAIVPFPGSRPIAA